MGCELYHFDLDSLKNRGGLQEGSWAGREVGYTMPLIVTTSDSVKHGFRKIKRQSNMHAIANNSEKPKIR